MSKYMTDQRFAGQPASVGRIVLLAAAKHDGEGVCLRAGIIVAVSSKDDRPYIQDLKTGQVDWDAPAWRFFASGGVVIDLGERMPVGTWTWPPRV